MARSADEPADPMTLRLPLPMANLADSGPWTLSDETAHYVLRVHRRVSGDECIAFDEKGQERAVVLQVEDESVHVEAIGPVQLGRSGYPIRMVYGLPKGDKLDRVTRQLTELGCTSLVLVNTERAVVRWPDARREKKLQRLERIVTEAARQSGRCDTMSVHGPLSLSDALERCAGDRFLVLDPTGQAPCPTLNSDTSVSLFVGPEGGFTPTSYRSSKTLVV